MYDGFLTYQVVLDTRRVSNPSSPNQDTFSSAKGGHLEVKETRPGAVWERKTRKGSTKKTENKLPLEKGETPFLGNPDFGGGSMFNFKGVYNSMYFWRDIPTSSKRQLLQALAEVACHTERCQCWNPLSCSFQISHSQVLRDGIGWKVGPLPGTSEQWKKGPWLFRLHKGLYYPIIWGL